MKKRKQLVLSLGALAIVGTAIGFTIAISHDSSVMNNEFQISDFETQFVETFNSPSNWKTCETVNKEIKVKNNTGADIVARIKLEEEWTASDGMGLPLVSNGSGERMAIINMTQNSGWTLDGTYYYSPTLAAGETSTSVISGVTLNCAANLAVDARYANANYKLSAKVETIQAEMAATEWHKISVLLPFDQVSNRITAVLPTYQSDNYYSGYKFLEADSLGIDPNTASSNNIISADYLPESNTRTYLWFNGEDKAVYWYSDADDVYLSNISGTCSGGSGIFARFADVSGLYNVNTSRVTYICDPFDGYEGTSLHGLEKWDVSHIVHMYDFFEVAHNLADISALARWDVSSVVDMGYLFNDDRALSDFSPLIGWNTASLQEMNMSFRGTSIADVCVLSSWNLTKVTALNEMFDGIPDFYSRDYKCLEPWTFSPFVYHSLIFDNRAGTRDRVPSWYLEWFPYIR